jgi:Protein of unknown function (DUF2505)
MQISSTLEFPADPERVYAMMTDRGYLEAVCEASQAINYEVSVDGQTTTTRRTLPAPPAAARFTGSQLTMVEQVEWRPAAADGTRSGTMTMKVPGQPVTLKGELTLAPGGAGTAATLTGDLKVAVPLLGKKLEEAAAPAVLSGFRVQQKVGSRWLAS